jgi:hypothetical protein
LWDCVAGYAGGGLWPAVPVDTRACASETHLAQPVALMEGMALAKTLFGGEPTKVGGARAGGVGAGGGRDQGLGWDCHGARACVELGRHWVVGAAAGGGWRVQRECLSAPASAFQAQNRAKPPNPSPIPPKTAPHCPCPSSPPARLPVRRQRRLLPAPAGRRRVRGVGVGRFGGWAAACARASVGVLGSAQSAAQQHAIGPSASALTWLWFAFSGCVAAPAPARDVCRTHSLCAPCAPPPRMRAAQVLRGGSCGEAGRPGGRLRQQVGLPGSARLMWPPLRFLPKPSTPPSRLTPRPRSLQTPRALANQQSIPS